MKLHTALLLTCGIMTVTFILATGMRSAAQHPLPRPMEHPHSEYQHFQEPIGGRLDNQCLHVVMRGNAIATAVGRCW